MANNGTRSMIGPGNEISCQITRFLLRKFFLKNRKMLRVPKTVIKKPSLFIMTFLFLMVFAFPVFSQTGNAEKADVGAENLPDTKVSEKKSGELKVSGLLREDAHYLYFPDNRERKDYFANLLETRLILDRSREDWSFYADGRLYLYSGEFQKIYGPTKLNLMRAMMRYFSPVGDFTLGKIYVNFGNSGLFNPFEIDKLVQLSDLQYAREGLYAFEYYFPWQELSGLKAYAGFHEPFKYNPVGGISPSWHIGKFDLGGVFNHSGPGKNLAGIYFKGDALVGIQGSWGAHTDDQLEYRYSEVSGGIDYSFLEGKIVATLLFYYNENGADDYKKYVYNNESFLLAKYYGFFSFAWMIDEFWNIQLNGLANFVDRSAVIMPNVSVLITNGLRLFIQMNYYTEKKDAEFSREKSGDFYALIRVEGKF